MRVHVNGKNASGHSHYLSVSGLFPNSFKFPEFFVNHILYLATLHWHSESLDTPDKNKCFLFS